jgi:hypothetical protein
MRGDVTLSCIITKHEQKLTTAYFHLSLLQKLKGARSSRRSSTSFHRVTCAGNLEQSKPLTHGGRPAHCRFNAAKAAPMPTRPQPPVVSPNPAISRIPLTETKRACQTLQQEQTAVSSSATTIQSQVAAAGDADLARALRGYRHRGAVTNIESSTARCGKGSRQTLVETSQHQQRN